MEKLSVLKLGYGTLCVFVIAATLQARADSFVDPKSRNERDISEMSPKSPKSGQHSKCEESSEFSSDKIKSDLCHSSKVMSKTRDDDKLSHFKNVKNYLDSNHVELPESVELSVKPSETDNSHPVSKIKPATRVKGEHVALQGRALERPEHVTPTATTNEFATLSTREKARDANPDIQDIITGLVKFLNGNVNVQADAVQGMGRPARPHPSRINNRGPPKITDVPALPPDFDVPAPPLPPLLLGPVPPPTSTRPPTPYPFELPFTSQAPKRPYLGNTGMSDKVMPGKRPTLYRPTVHNWIHPTTRKPQNKPIGAHMPSDIMISMTSDKPVDDILTLDLDTQLQDDETKNTESKLEETVTNQENRTLESNNATTQNKTSQWETIDQETEYFEKNKEKNPKPDKSNKVTLVTPTLNMGTSVLETPIVLVTENIVIATTSDVAEMSPTPVNSSVTLETSSEETATSSSILLLEPSIMDSIQSTKDQETNLSSQKTQELVMVSSVSQESTNTKFIDSSSVSNETNYTVHQTGVPNIQYKPRPGIVLDDTEYKPGGFSRQPIVAKPQLTGLGDIFDITVSAIQGPGPSAGQGKPYIIPVDIEHLNSASPTDVITSPVGNEGFVSIDGKRTYLNIFGDSTPTMTTPSHIKPSGVNNQVVATGINESHLPRPSIDFIKPTQRRPIYSTSRPNHPPVRIDTCIVGDDSTCDVSQHEICRTELGISSCHCRPGTARRKLRDPCRNIISLVLSLRVDRIYDRRVVWVDDLLEKNGDKFEQLAFESEKALESAMSMTPFSDEYLGSKVNNIYKGDRSQGRDGVFVNITLQLEENADTSRTSVKGEIQKQLLGVLQRRNNNVGKSALWVDSLPGSISSLQDLDECTSQELHDCHEAAKCINIFGGFKCECLEGYRDLWANNKYRGGRECEQCSPKHCSNRGECKFQNGQEVCVCSGNYYGTQCELDGEVLGVAIGASAVAIIIIGLTLVCLVMWSRRWNKEQKTVVGSPVFGYMATANSTVKTPVVGTPPYQFTLQDRLRWAQVANVMAQANHYAPEPSLVPNRSSMFGYPTLPVGGTLQIPNSLRGLGSTAGSLPPVPLPRLQAHLAGMSSGMCPLDSNSSSEEEDKTDLLGRNFQVPRPKSRSNASIAVIHLQ
ncbi:uncharacterized protein LOC132708653 isoform X2 [Cylas formicarius]|uniref:uncharacterized protein LOC132708653 isoform X2 n=1 Tax=Cylas formicarius TaxID=197179 RepID=UPI0029586075|nr:uncharacterized protein LOC132708653 isoform X2 [Cylas formicarius]